MHSVPEASLKKEPCRIDASCPAAGPDTVDNEEISPSTSIPAIAGMQSNDKHPCFV